MIFSQITEEESKRLKKKRKEKVKKWMLEKATESTSESRKHKHKKHKHKHRHRHSSSGSSSESFVKTDQDGAVSDDVSKPIVKEDVGPIMVAEKTSSVKEERKDSEENVKQEEVEKEDIPNGEVEDTGKEADAPNALKSDDEISSFDDDQAKGKKPKVNIFQFLIIFEEEKTFYNCANFLFIFCRKSMSVRIRLKQAKWLLFYHLVSCGVGQVKDTSAKVPKAGKRNSLNVSKGTRNKSM